MKRRATRILQSGSSYMFIVVMMMSMTIAGCGGGGGGSSYTSAPTVPVSLSEEEKVKQAIENSSSVNDIGFSDETVAVAGKSAQVSYAQRSTTTITRTLVDIIFEGDCCAFADAVFELTGTITFKDSSGTSISSKPISMVAEGTYELVKDSSTGEWTIVADPIDSGLVFTQGASVPSITSFTTSPESSAATPLPAGSTAGVIVQASTSGLFAMFQSKKLNVRAELSGSSGTYSGSIQIPSTAASGKYVAVIDTVVKTPSFDLTGDPNFTNSYTGTLKAIKVSVGVVSPTYTSLAISCASSALVVGETTSCSATAGLSDGTTATLAPVDVTWILSPSTSGTITAGGILTASVSGTLTVTATFGSLTSNAVTITVSPSTSQTIAGYISAAKSSLFKTNLVSTDVDTARTNVLNALALDPNHPDANFLSAVINIITEWDRIKQNVLTPASSIYPFGGYSLQKQVVARVLSPMAEPLLSSLPKARSVSYTLSDNPPDQLHAELEANTLPVIEQVVAELQKVENYIASNASYTFTYPKDPAFPELGDNTIDVTDVDALMGAMKVLRGASYFALAYDATSPTGYWDADLNDRVQDDDGNGFAVPSEYFPPSPFGLLRSSGSTYLANSKTDMIAGLTLIRDAVNTVLAEVTQTAGGIALTTTVVADLNQYKHYLDEALQSLSGTTTAFTLAGTNECWHAGSPVTRSYVFDPTYNTGMTCDFTVTNRASLTVNVNLAAAFVPVSDLRSLAPTLIQSDTDSILTDPDTTVDGSNIGHKINKNWVFYSLPDDTLNGVVPGGVQKTWFDESTANRDFSFEIDTASATTAGCTTIVSSATLAIGSKSFSASSCTVRSNPTGYVIGFKTSTTSVPASADVYTFNAYTGTSATLSVPGFQPVSLIISDSEAMEDVISVPAIPAKIKSSFLHPMMPYLFSLIHG